jgi:prepilin-type N-terminal cleavage/methylation domain-containing protein
MKRPAFTMLELVFVILVLGIIAALAMPRLERDTRQEAADNILNAIRYTQHMALIDDVTNPNDNEWQKAFWRFGFEKCSDNGLFYYIGSDKDTEGNIDSGEELIDPMNGLSMMGLNNQPCEQDISTQVNKSPNIFITKNYNIKFGDVAWSAGCTGTSDYIGFDHAGRPHRGYTASTTPDYSSVLTSDCNLTLTFDNTNLSPLVFTIEKETGYVFVVDQESL